MAVRKAAPDRTPAERRDQCFNGINKLYLTWAIGVIIGALGLKPTSINAAGLILSVERPEIIQGIVYLICLYEAYILFFVMIQFRPYSGRDVIRYNLWRALPKGRRSFRGGTLRDFKFIRAKARLFTRFSLWTNLVVIVIPPLVILAYNRQAVEAAIRAILGKAMP
jgi:hypothetical protein